MSKRRPLYSWVFEKLVEYGNDNGGMGWMMYWMFGLMCIAIFDVAILRSNGSIIFFGYLGITFIYLVVKGIQNAYRQYLEETEDESS